MSRSDFIPPDFDAADLSQIEPLYRELRDRAIRSSGDLERWLQDASDLEEHLDEEETRRYIANTCHTDDKEAEAAYLSFVETVEPRVKEWGFELRRRFVESPHRAELEGRRMEILGSRWKNQVALFREENLPLETRESKLFSDYGKIMGAMTVEWEGEQRTLQQMGKLLEEPDRAIRERAWLAMAERRAVEAERLDAIFDELLGLRAEIARQAGFAEYRDYAFRKRERFDYGPRDCLRLGDAIAELCLPLVESLDRERRARLGVDRLRPWDLAVDPDGRPPLRPFAEDRVDDLIAGVGEIFSRISPALAERFRRLEPGRNLDLESRPGKRPGGYQAALEVSRQPFIFMNAVGTQRDVETLLHESGHAFHYLDAASEPLVFLRHAPLEFCEVASMSMELLGSAHLDVFYDEADAGRARHKLLEGIVRFLPWMATIDGFQHWLYTHPGHTGAERQAAWKEIEERFTSREVDWSGFEEFRARRWHAQLHLFGMPFYYIEYGIAQMGALQVWLRSMQDLDGTLERLRRAFALGGGASLPELFDEAGLRFELTSATLGPLLSALEQALDEE